MGNCQAQGGNFQEASHTINGEPNNQDNASFNPAQANTEKNIKITDNQPSHPTSEDAASALLYSIETEPAAHIVSHLDHHEIKRFNDIQTDTVVLEGTLGNEIQVTHNKSSSFSPDKRNTERTLKASPKKAKSNKKVAAPAPYDAKLFVSMIAKAAENIDEILYQGPLLKYKPGMHVNWVERWCVLTRREFRYYKNEWVARCPDLHPLITVPVTAIVGSYTVNIDVPHVQIKDKNPYKGNKSNNKTVYQFEIFKKNGDYPYAEESQQQPNNDGQVVKKVNTEEFQSFKLWEDFEEQRRTQRHTPSKRTPGHLMKSPLRTSRNESLVGLSATTARGFTSERGSPLKTSVVSPLRSPLGSPQREVQSAKKPVTARNNSPAKEPTYKYARGKAELISWSGRAKEWYMAENRLLFATANSVEREKWLAALNWLVHEAN